MKNQVQLIAYVDRLGGGGIEDLRHLLGGPLHGLFGGVHLLPFYDPIDGADAGFDPIDHGQVDPRLGSWEEIRNLSQDIDIMADLIVNHISADSAQFQAYMQQGQASPYADLFLTMDKVFPRGATEADLLRIYRPRPGLPFTYANLQDGTKRILWTTFTSQQVDIDVQHALGDRYLKAILQTFQRYGIRMIRLDAAGYAIKKAGTSCFMIPETFEFIQNLTDYARSLGIEVLVEIHAYYQRQIEIARLVDRVYDFVLPSLLLHAIFNQTARHLKQWLNISPRNAITVLDTHDGIGIIDIGADGQDPLHSPGLVPPADIDMLVETIHQRSGGQSRQATGAAASNVDLYQVNCTYYDALGRRDNEYLLARAVQFFCPGIPQVYYVGLLAGKNDMALLAKTNVGRDINRSYYAADELKVAMDRHVVGELMRLIRLRNQHPAFNGTFHLMPGEAHRLSLRWELAEQWIQLDVDFQNMDYQICFSREGRAATF